MAVFEASELAAMRAEHAERLEHTYTRTTAAHDQYGQPVSGGAVTTTGLACFYQDPKPPTLSPTGDLTVPRPTLQVAYSDTLAVGDQVSNITSDGAVRKAGPFVVQAIRDSDPGGGVVARIADLGDAQVA